MSNRSARLASTGLVCASLALLIAAVATPLPARAQVRGAQPGPDEELVQLDFDDVELKAVIDTIALYTGKNFIYDDRVRGRVTVISPTKVTVDQAYKVFESVLQVKGFTTVDSPGGVIKIIPIRDAKEASIDTREQSRGTPLTDRYVTRLIPLSYIDAQAIANTLRPLVSKEASLVAYGPTNTLILTDAASNIRRVLSIIEAIDVELYKEDLAVIRLEYADASSLAQQLSEIFGGQVSTTAATPAQRRRARTRQRAQQAVQPTTSDRSQVRILTDERTNALIVLAARTTLEEIRSFVRKLDVPVEGGGRIQVHYLKHADAEELADTLNSLLSGRAPTATGAGGAAQQQLRATVTELAGGVTSITSDPATNSLVIQASPEGFEALVRVIERLDVERPQVLVEALIMEVDVTDAEDLGFTGIFRIVNGDTDLAIATGASALGGPAAGGIVSGQGAPEFLTNFFRNTIETDADGNPVGNGTTINGIIRASATDNDANILSSPHILTSDNEEAEIVVGDNIPIITSRVQSAAGVEVGLSSSVNVDRQDIGVTLRVTPQISEGDTLRLEIFQEVTQINESLTGITGVGRPEEVGVALSNRRVENTVVVNDGDTVVIGGLISDLYSDNVNKVPFLGDIPVFGWLFKSTSKSLQKRNLLIFLTPHIIRSRDDLEAESIRKREEFRERSEEQLGGPRELEMPADEVSLLIDEDSDSATESAVRTLEKRHPIGRLEEIEAEEQREAEARRAAAGVAPTGFTIVAGQFREAERAQEVMIELVDAGYEGLLVSRPVDGSVLFEVQVGPYDALRDAERAAATLERAYELEPKIVVERAAQPETPDGRETDEETAP